MTSSSSICKVWDCVDESQFHENIILLEVLNRSQRIPWKNLGSKANLPHTVDACENALNWVKPFLDDFALVAAQEGRASNVAAACLEESLHGLPEVTIKVAKNGPFREKQLACLHNIIDLMNAVRDGELQKSAAETECFRLIANSCMSRMTHHVRGPKGLQQLLLPEHLLGNERLAEPNDLSAMLSEDSCMGKAKRKYYQIAELVENSSSGDHDGIKQIVVAAYELRRNTSFRDLLSKLHPGQHNHIAKIIEKIGKIARFYRSATTFVDAAHISGWRFKISIVPSCSRKVQVLSSKSAPDLKSRLPKSKAFSREQLEEIQRLVQRWRRYIVHAEMQLLIYFEQNPLLRTVKNYIGISKRCCFLCAEFIKIHGRFNIEGVHQQLYSLWTLPSYMEFPDSDGSKKFCDVLKRLNGVVCKQIKQINRLHYTNLPYNAESVANFSRASIFAPVKSPSFATKIGLLSLNSSQINAKAVTSRSSLLLSEKDGHKLDSSKLLLVEEAMETSDLVLPSLETQTLESQEDHPLPLAEATNDDLTEQECNNVPKEVAQATCLNDRSEPALDNAANNAISEISNGEQAEVNSKIPGVQEDPEEILGVCPNEKSENADTSLVGGSVLDTIKPKIEPPINEVASDKVAPPRLSSLPQNEKELSECSPRSRKVRRKSNALDSSKEDRSIQKSMKRSDRALHESEPAMSRKARTRKRRRRTRLPSDRYNGRKDKKRTTDIYRRTKRTKSTAFFNHVWRSVFRCVSILFTNYKSSKSSPRVRLG